MSGGRAGAARPWLLPRTEMGISGAAGGAHAARGLDFGLESGPKELDGAAAARPFKRISAGVSEAVRPHLPARKLP